MNKNLTKPLISVIVNCFNGENYLHEALQSVVSQTYENWELIFWNNCSTDNSENIFLQYANERFFYYESAEHSTLGMARKMALEKAKGEWIAFLDCDDYWTEDKLELQILALNSTNYKNIGLIYTDTTFIRLSKNSFKTIYTSKNFYNFKSFPQGDLFNLLSFDCFFTLVSCLFNREILISVGGVDQKLKHAEDYDLFLKISARSNIIGVDRVCCIYRLHNSNLTWSSSELIYLEPLYNRYKVGQSVAIARYIAKLAGIAGKNEIDQALADGLVDFVTDFLNGENMILEQT